MNDEDFSISLQQQSTEQLKGGLQFPRSQYDSLEVSQQFSEQSETLNQEEIFIILQRPGKKDEELELTEYLLRDLTV